MLIRLVSFYKLNPSYLLTKLTKSSQLIFFLYFFASLSLELEVKRSLLEYYPKYIPTGKFSL